MKIENLDVKIKSAAKLFWTTREKQGKKQISSGKADAGFRSAVTGGKQMMGFEAIAIEIALKAGIPKSCIHQSICLELPGYFRPTKKWDLVFVDGSKLVAAIEFKSQVGPSFGNNFNNRLEEALGSATDLWTAYREKAFGQGTRPWLGYFFILEDCERSRAPVKVNEPHFKVFPEFKNASYAKRYELLMKKLLLERHYDGAALLLSTKPPVRLKEPSPQLRLKGFFAQLSAHIQAHVESK